MPRSDTTVSPPKVLRSSLPDSERKAIAASGAGIARIIDPNDEPQITPPRQPFSDVAHEHVHIAPIDGAVRVIVGDQYIDKPMPRDLAMYYAAAFLDAARKAKA